MVGEWECKVDNNKALPLSGVGGEWLSDSVYVMSSANGCSLFALQGLLAPCPPVTPLLLPYLQLSCILYFPTPIHFQ